MPKTFEFEGQHYDFPDDVSDDEALGFIGKIHGSEPSDSGLTSKALKAPKNPFSLPEAPPAEPSMWDKTKSLAGSAMGVLGTPVRGLGMLTELAREGLGAPSEIRISQDSNSLTGSGISQPGLGERSMQGLENIVDSSQALKTTAQRASERDALLGTSALGQVARYGRAAGTTGLGAVVDPSMLVLGPIGQAAQRSATAAKVFSGLQRSMQAGIGIQSIGGVQEYVKAGQEHGFDSAEANNVGAEVLAQLALVGGLEGEGHRVRKTLKASEAPSLPKAPPTLEAAVQEATPSDRGVSPNVLPEAPLPEGISFPTEGKELEQRFRSAAKDVRTQEKAEGRVAADTEKDRFKAARVEVAALEAAERAKNAGIAEPGSEQPNSPSLPEPPEEIFRDELGGGAQGSGAEAGPGGLSESSIESGPPAPQPSLPGPPAQGAEVLQPRGAESNQVLSGGVANGPEALGGENQPPSGVSRRVALSDNQQMAAVAVANEFSGKTPSRAEILTRLAGGDMPTKLRPGGDRIQKVASEVERLLQEKNQRGLPPAPDETPLLETQNGNAPTQVGNELPKAPKTFEERMAEKEAALRASHDNPIAHEDEFTETGNVAEGSPEELSAAMQRHLAPLEEGQALPAQLDRPKISGDLALKVREAALNNPAYKKAAELGNRVRQLLGEGTQKYRAGFDVAPTASGDILPTKGFTSKEGRGVTNNPHTLAKIAVENAARTGTDVQTAFANETVKNMWHELWHETAKDTAHTDKLSSDLGRTKAREVLENMKNEKGEGIFSPEELEKLAPKGAENLTQSEKFNYLHGLFDKVDGGALNGLVDSLKNGMTPEDIHSLAEDYQKLVGELKGEKGVGESGALNEAQDELPKAPDELDMSRPDRGAMAADLVPTLIEGAKKAVGVTGKVAARTNMANLAGGLWTTLNNTVNGGGKVAMHQLSDAVWGLAEGEGSASKARTSARFKSLADTIPDMFDTAKLKFSKNPELSKGGKDIESLREFGRKNLPRLTDQTFGQYAGEAARMGGESKMGPVEAKIDAFTHATMLPAIMSERALTANQVRTSLSKLMADEKVMDLEGLVKKANTYPQTKVKLTNALARAMGEANAMRFGRSAFTEKSSKNPVSKVISAYNSFPGFVQLGVSNLAGTPFAKAVLANAFTDAVEFFPGMNKLSKRVRYAPELEALEKKSEAGSLSKEDSRRLKELQETGPYGKEFIRGQQVVGPTALMMGMAVGMYMASANDTPGTVKGEEDKKGTWRKGLQGAMGSAYPAYALGEYIGRARKGNDPRFDPSVGKAPDTGGAVQAVLQQRGGTQSTLGQLYDAITGAPAEKSKLKAFVDKYMAELGKNAVPSMLGDITEAGQEEKKPELPVKGETPGVDAFLRGAASRLPGARESVTSAIDPSTGEVKKAGPLPGVAEFPARARYMSNLTSFLDSHKSQMEGGVMLPQQHGLKSFDKNQFDFWKEGLKDDERVLVGRKPDGSLKRLSIDQVLSDSSIPDRVKSELLQKALPALVKESTNYATRKALEESKKSGTPPEIPEQSMIAALRKAQEEELLKSYGVPKARGRRLPPSSRGLSKTEQRDFRESLPEAPAY